MPTSSGGHDCRPLATSQGSIPQASSGSCDPWAPGQTHSGNNNERESTLAQDNAEREEHGVWVDRTLLRRDRPFHPCWDHESRYLASPQEIARLAETIAIMAVAKRSRLSFDLRSFTSGKFITHIENQYICFSVQDFLQHMDEGLIENVPRVADDMHDLLAWRGLLLDGRWEDSIIPDGSWFGLLLVMNNSLPAPESTPEWSA